jgi:hypothetical protein
MKNLKELNLLELKKLASKNKIGGRSKMNKNDLIKNLNKINKMKGGENINRTQYQGHYLNLEDIYKIMKNIKSGEDDYYFGSTFNPDFVDKIVDMNFVTINKQIFLRKNNKGTNIEVEEPAKKILQLTLEYNNEQYIRAVYEYNLYLIGNIIYEISDVENINRNLGQENINMIEKKHRNNFKSKPLEQASPLNY